MSACGRMVSSDLVSRYVPLWNHLMEDHKSEMNLYGLIGGGAVVNGNITTSSVLDEYGQS